MLLLVEEALQNGTWLKCVRTLEFNIQMHIYLRNLESYVKLGIPKCNINNNYVSQLGTKHKKKWTTKIKENKQRSENQ